MLFEETLGLLYESYKNGIEAGYDLGYENGYEAGYGFGYMEREHEAVSERGERLVVNTEELIIQVVKKLEHKLIKLLTR